MESLIRVANVARSNHRRRPHSNRLKRSNDDRIIRVTKAYGEHCYIVKETIAEGVTAKVKRALLVKPNMKMHPKEVALKIFKLDGLAYEQHEESVIREANVLAYLSTPRNRHPNIVKMYEILNNVEYRSKHGRPSSSYDRKTISGLVLEYIDGGELYDYVNTGMPLQLDFVQAIFQQLVRAVSHLHANNIVHLDIKPENVILSKSGMVVLTDFGSAQMLPSDHYIYSGFAEEEEKEAGYGSDIGLEVSIGSREMSNSSLTSEEELPAKGGLLYQSPMEYRFRNSNIPKSVSLCELDGLRSPAHVSYPKTRSNRRRSLIVTSQGGTLKYRAPEVEDNKPFDGAAADVWSLGMVLYVMLYKQLPDPSSIKKINEYYLSERRRNAEEMEQNPASPEKLGYADLLCGLLCLDPKERLTVKEIRNHQWVNASKVTGSAHIVARNIKHLEAYVDDAQRRKKLLRQRERDLKKSSSLNSLNSVASSASFDSSSSMP